MCTKEECYKIVTTFSTFPLFLCFILSILIHCSSLSDVADNLDGLEKYSAVYVKVLSEPMNFLLRVSPSKEMRDWSKSWVVLCTLHIHIAAMSIIIITELIPSGLVASAGNS